MSKACSSVCLLQGTSVCQVTGVGAVVILLYSSRACYNLLVLALSNKSISSFDYDWYNVSDQVRRSLQEFWENWWILAGGRWAEKQKVLGSSPGADKAWRVFW